MKKMMFDDRYVLTEAVIENRKTETRRVVKIDYGFDVVKNYGSHLIAQNTTTLVKAKIFPTYKVGEIVAVAQSYKDAGIDFIPQDLEKPRKWGFTKRMKAWLNKMFVYGDLMPHQIQILGVRAERLQDITEEDCLREYPECDTIKERHINKVISMGASVVDNWMTRRDVFAWLIDKISGKGTWESNPFVWVYEFKLVK